MAGMRLGFGIVQVGTLEGEMHGKTPSQIWDID